VALYHDGPAIFIRRSTDSGATWNARQELGSDGLYNAIAGSGTDVDVVWWEGGFTAGSALHYRHSADSGVSFSAPVDLATGSYPDDWYIPNLARRRNVVASIWYDGQPSLIRIRISTDGGASFGSVTDLATVSTPYGPRPAVAVGNGVIYAAYFVDETHVNMRRSLDDGATWTPAIELAPDAIHDYLVALSLTAARDHAYLAYATKSGVSEWVRYVRTIDKGATWTTAADLSSPSGHPSYHPVIDLDSGVVRIVYYECTVSNCSNAVVTYRQSSNGTTWTAPETASLTATSWADPTGVGYAGRVIVLYGADHGDSPDGCACDVYVSIK
jgi:hypothetical protein